MFEDNVEMVGKVLFLKFSELSMFVDVEPS